MPFFYVFIKNSNQLFQKALHYVQLKDFNSAEKEIHQITSKLYEIMTKLDVVITTSNFTTHLASLFEITTIPLIPRGRWNIWYWHNEKESFWYPSIRLVKQKKSGDWVSVKDELISLL
jgi:hypothetical protein